jgi:hypothetical protein|tara:strand:- start:481 stop:729 length:249 start_codon:yes stop_codon:yes gene_type:complete
MRRAGYSMQQNKKGEISFTKRLAGADYPRFHIYINKEEPGKMMEVSLHLDEKKPSYEGFTAHSGQYDGEVVELEQERILKSI